MKTLWFRNMSGFICRVVWMLYFPFLIEREESSVYIYQNKEGDNRKNCPNGQILNPFSSLVPVLL